MTDAISPLVDSLSSLILTAVSGDIRVMKEVIPQIASYTEAVVLAARDIAVASHDVQVQLDMSGSINNVANAINQLVTAFTSYLSNKTDTNLQKGFATATKDVGDAINSLVAAADVSSLAFLFASIQETKASSNDLLAQSQEQSSMVHAARRLGAVLLTLLDDLDVAAKLCFDGHKGSQLLSFDPRLKSTVTNFIRAAGPLPSATNPTFKAAYDTVIRDLDELLAVARTPADYSQGFRDAFDSALARLSDLAAALSKFSRQLADLLSDPNHKHADFVDIASKTAKTAKAFLEMAARQLLEITDPGRRRMVEGLMKDIQQLSTDIVKTAQQLQADPTNQALRAKLNQLNNVLEEKLQNLLLLTSPEGENAMQKFNLTSRYLDGLVAEMSANLENLTPEELLAYADAIQQLTLTAANDAKAAAAAAEDPKDRDRILGTLPNLVTTCKTLVGTTHTLAATPRDAELRKRWAQDKDAFRDALYDVRVAACLELPRPPKSIPAPPPPVPRDTDHELVRAATEQAAAALALAARAREFASSITDPSRKAGILAGAARLEDLGNRLIERARYAAEHPNDAQAQADLDALQRELAEAIRAIVELTAGKGSSLASLLQDMELSAGGSQDDTLIFGSVDDLLREIDSFVANLARGTLPPHELVAQARLLAQKAADLAKALMTLAARTEDKTLQNQLKQAATILRDKGVQIKMLAAVEVAGGSTGTGQVANSVQGLRTEVGETARILRVSALRRRVHRTNKQTEYLRRLLGAWNEAHQLLRH